LVHVMEWYYRHNQTLPRETTEYTVDVITCTDIVVGGSVSDL